MSRLKTVTLAPTVLDRNGISTTETLAAARLDYLINGALATGFDRDGICAAQTPASAAAMTLNGASGIDFTSRNGVYVMIYAGGDESGRTFTVVGTDSNNQIITEGIMVISILVKHNTQLSIMQVTTLEKQFLLQVKIVMVTQ